MTNLASPMTVNALLYLALLRHGRLIEPRREGKNNYYRLLPDGERLVECVRVLVEG
jgi:DNA-binding transcriptional ArsR family regulator